MEKLNLLLVYLVIINKLKISKILDKILKESLFCLFNNDDKVNFYDAKFWLWEKNKYQRSFRT